MYGIAFKSWSLSDSWSKDQGPKVFTSRSSSSSPIIRLICHVTPWFMKMPVPLLIPITSTQQHGSRSRDRFSSGRPGPAVRRQCDPNRRANRLIATQGKWTEGEGLGRVRESEDQMSCRWEDEVK